MPPEAVCIGSPGIETGAPGSAGIRFNISGWRCSDEQGESVTRRAGSPSHYVAV